jgi:hypothetical protein
MNLNSALLSFILTFCISPTWAEVTPTLNSDAIKATFGSYGVTILNQTESTRDRQFVQRSQRQRNLPDTGGD